MSFFYKIHILIKKIERRISPVSEEKRMKYLYKYKQAYPKVKSIDETIDFLLNSNASICRYGDGEFHLCLGKDINFQKHSKLLQKRLLQIVNSSNSDCIVGIIDYVLENLTTYSKEFWYENVKFIVKFLKKEEYYNARITRELTFDQINSMKKIWNNKDIIFVTGENSRFDVNHELFENIKSCQTLYYKSNNAFSEYDKIFEEVKQEAKKIDFPLVICALGPTATILTYDLSQEGIRTLDLGHITNIYDNLKYNIPKPEKLAGNIKN